MLNGKRKVLLSFILAFTSPSILAANAHSWHTVSSLNGTWSAKLQMINEEGIFIDENGASLSSFTITPDQSQRYGFIFDPTDDFNVAYTLTLVEQSSNHKSTFTGKTCVYVISATGPALPQVVANGYGGAKCEWQVVPGVGENYTVA